MNQKTLNKILVEAKQRCALKLETMGDVSEQQEFLIMKEIVEDTFFEYGYNFEEVTKEFGLEIKDPNN